jgi:ABC-type transport system substrate-binding protein
LIQIIVIIVLSTSACNFIFDIGLERPSTDVPVTLELTENSPVSTQVPTLQPSIPPTETPTDMPTLTPSPTPLPGFVVVPISSMSSKIPWLPLDKTRRPGTYVATINTQKPPFNDPLVRQAFAAAIDREAITEIAQDHYAIDPSPATTYLPPQMLGLNLYNQVGIPFDPVRAKDLLTQAGYSDTSTFPKVTFIVNQSGSDIGMKYLVATTMAEMWMKHLGVTVDVVTLANPYFGQRLKGDMPEIAMLAWIADDPGNDPDDIRNIYRTGMEANFGLFSNSDFDMLVDRARSTGKPQTRQEMYIQAERILCETEAGIIPLFHTFFNIP